MKKRMFRGFQFSFVLLLILSMFTALPALANDGSTQIDIDDESGTSILSTSITDGEYVVYNRASVSVHSSCASINAARLDGGEQFSVGTIGKSAPMAVDDGYVITGKEPSRCQDNVAPDPALTPGVSLIDLATGQRDTLFDAENGPLAVAIDYPYVAWIIVDLNASPVQMTVWAMNVETDAAPVEVKTEDRSGSPAVYLFLDADTVYWVTTYGSNGVGNAARATIGGSTTYFRSMHDTRGVAISGDIMVTVTEGRPLYNDRSTGQNMWLSDSETSAVATDGRYIFWVTTTETESYISAFDTFTHSRFEVSDMQADESANTAIRNIDARNGAVAWSYCCQNTWMSSVHGVMLVDRLPSAAHPDPGTTSPDWTYFPETGHYLANDFRVFWNNNGGLPVFGYPLTEEFDYLSPETGNSHAAQMTERQRFEWHPENIGTPYAVLLGRLGETILQEQGRDWHTFEKADPSAEHYFEATGHAIAPEFYDYWASHGLDLGHAGVSFDESLALFGYPLSEPMMETNADGDTVLTQYFERAVFEYHPDNPASSQVLLRRLGAELMDSWGW